MSLRANHGIIGGPLSYYSNKALLRSYWSLEKGEQEAAVQCQYIAMITSVHVIFFDFGGFNFNGFISF